MPTVLAAADELDIAKQPWILTVAVLIPLSIWVSSAPNVGMVPVLLIRLCIILLMNFLNKESVEAFPIFFILTYQMLVQAVMVMVGNWRKLSCGKRGDLKQWLLIMTPLWALQLLTSLFAFEDTSVSTIQVIRSVLPLMSFAMEKFLYDDPKTISWALMGSMLLVVLGTTLYGYSSVSVTSSALLYIFLNSAFTVMSTVYRSKFLKDPNFSVSLPLAVCSVAYAATPVFIACAIVTGEIKQWPAALRGASLTAWFWTTLSAFVAGCFSLLQGRCQTIISGTSDLMFQNFVKVFIIVMGIVAFGDAFTLTSFTACIIALGGCAWYGYLRVAKECSTGGKTQSSAVDPEGSNEDPQGIHYVPLAAGTPIIR